MSKHRGKEITKWLDLLIKEAKSKEMAPKQSVDIKVNAKDIEFSSPLFSATNMADALNESRGIVLGQFDLLNQPYSKKATVRQVLEKLVEDRKYEFNENMIELFGEKAPQQTHEMKDAIDELVKMLYRAYAEISKLRMEVDKMKPVSDEYKVMDHG